MHLYIIYVYTVVCECTFYYNKYEYSTNTIKKTIVTVKISKYIILNKRNIVNSYVNII